MHFRLFICLLVCGYCSCSSRPNKALEQCERELDSLETLLEQHPGYAASHTVQFMELRTRITKQIDALNEDKKLGESDVQQRDMLALRSSLLFTAAMEQALELTRRQSDSLKNLRDSTKSGN